MKSRDGFAAAILVFVVLALVVIGGIAYVHYVYLPRMAVQNEASPNQIATTTTSSVVATSTNIAPTSINTTPSSVAKIPSNPIPVAAALPCSYSDATNVGIVLKASFPSYIDTSNIEALSDGDNSIINQDISRGLFCVKARTGSVDSIVLANKTSGYQIWATVVNPQAGQQYTIDANSTAISVLFITPYFYNSNPATAGTILSAIAKDPDISTLAQTVQSTPHFADEFTSSTSSVGTVFQAAILNILKTLTATSTNATTPTGIKFTSPTGGDTWSLSSGAPYEIDWVYQGIPSNTQTQIYLYLPDGTQCDIGANPIGGEKTVINLSNVPCNGTTQKANLVPGRYSLAIIVEGQNGSVIAAGQSEWFNITQ